MDDLKVYSPQVIEDNPFPQSGVQPFAVVASQPSAGGIYSPARIEEQVYPTKRIATELLSNVLNTKSQKILKEIQFTKSGALQIGEYANGVTGDVRISPDGIVGRNKSGVNTFTLDGDTGDATFAGTVQTGAVVAGQMVVGDSAIQIDGVNKRMLFYDANGIPIIVIGTVPS